MFLTAIRSNVDTDTSHCVLVTSFYFHEYIETVMKMFRNVAEEKIGCTTIKFGNAVSQLPFHECMTEQIYHVVTNQPKYPFHV